MYLMDKYEINNHVNINDLKHDKTWIHGSSKNDIIITIFLITIQGEQLKYAIDSINELPLKYNILIHVIMNISPTAKAYNCMVTRCTTPYFIQMDEDMEFLPDALDIIYSNLRAMKKYYVQIYHLIDDYLGINNPPVIFGMKVYNNTVMKHYPVPNMDFPTSSVDQLWHKSLECCGFEEKFIHTYIGTHGKHRSPFDIMLRYSKITKTMLDTNSQSRNGDKPKLLRPMNAIINFQTTYESVVCHYLNKKFDIDIFHKNNIKLIHFISNYSKNFTNYNIPYKYVKVSGDFEYNVTKNKLDFIKKYPKEKKMHLFAIIGIVNALFENYQYSYDQYPYEMYKYFVSEIDF
jgi:hypothetical protein